MAAQIEVPDHVTVGELAEVLQLPATRLIGELFKNGVVATINERLDFDTAQIIVGELGLDVELTRKAVDVELPQNHPLFMKIMIALLQGPQRDEINHRWLSSMAAAREEAA